MSKKPKGDKRGFVYSTDPNFQFEQEEEHLETLSPAQQPLTIRLDTKQRGGKSVTLIRGFVGSHSDLEALGKKVKSFCGTGGAVKEGEAIVQGDQREKVMQYLQKNGYTKARII